MSADLTGRVALVTGGASGIGRASAVALARAGAAVVAADLDPDGAHATAELITGAGGNAAACPCDVTDEADVDAAVAFAVEQFGGLHLAHNNAGIGAPPALTVDVLEADFDRVLAVDLTGVFLCMQHELRRLIAQGRGGAIVNISSAAGVIPAPGQPQYTAAKHGVLGLTKQVAQEYASQGIRVNAVLPGQTETDPMRAYLDALPDQGERMLRRLPMGRMARPDEIAQTAVWLCSDAASYVNGVSLLVDGGLIAR